MENEKFITRLHSEPIIFYSAKFPYIRKELLNHSILPFNTPHTLKPPVLTTLQVVNKTYQLNEALTK